METDEYCVEKVSFYQLNLLRLDVVMTLIYSEYLAPFLKHGHKCLIENFRFVTKVVFADKDKSGSCS